MRSSRFFAVMLLLGSFVLTPSASVYAAVRETNRFGAPVAAEKFGPGDPGHNRRQPSRPSRGPRNDPPRSHHHDDNKALAVGGAALLFGMMIGAAANSGD